MAILLSNCKVWLGMYDITGELNAVALDNNPNLLECTQMGDTGKKRVKSLPTVAASLAGFFDNVSNIGEKAIGSYFNVVNVPMTVSPGGGVEFETAYSFLAQEAEYVPFGGSIGELAKYTVKAENCGGKLIRGVIMENHTLVIVSADGTPRNLGLLGAGQTMYAALHVTGASVNDTLDVVIQSDELVGMGSPTPRITFAQVNGGALGVGSYEWKTLAGPIATDVYWRVVYTIVGGSPSFDFAVFIGIV